MLYKFNQTIISMKKGFVAVNHSEATDRVYLQAPAIGSPCCLFSIDGLISVALHVSLPVRHSSTT